MTRRTKIVCTLGPAVDSYEQVLALVEAGMDVARFNFSHGKHSEHGRRYDWVRRASDATGHAVAILADLQGPKIRLGEFAGGPVEWATGETVTITVRDVIGTHDLVSTTYKLLPGDVRPGDSILVDDGRVQLRVLSSSDTDVTLKVIEGGIVSDHKGINLPGVHVTTPALTDKDAEDLRYALGLRADFIALSFVRSAADIVPVHEIMDEYGARLPVIAKVEKPEAVQALDQIIAAFDGVMVARGDLGVEMHLEDVPLVQKLIIDHCRSQAKPVIVATQMLESMITNARPTRAEASDVANAALDGADALMLSGETSVGRFAVETVRTMARIISSAEQARVRAISASNRTQGGALGIAALDIAETLNAKAVIAFTQTGDTARRLARHHRTIPLLAFTPTPAVRSQLALSWGVETFLTDLVDSTDEMIAQVDEVLLKVDRAQRDELVVVVAGTPVATAGATNTIRLHRLGSV